MARGTKSKQGRQRELKKGLHGRMRIIFKRIGGRLSETSPCLHHGKPLAHAIGLDFNPTLSLTQIQVVIIGEPDLTSVFF